jgi:hypothetical protein
VQVSQEGIQEARERLRKEALIIKYASRWMKSLLYSPKCMAGKKKVVAVDLWRLNTTFDEGISRDAREAVSELEGLWKRR